MKNRCGAQLDQRGPPKPAPTRCCPFWAAAAAKPVLKTDLFTAHGIYQERVEDSLRACDVFIAIGGDGTIIHTAKLAASLGQAHSGRERRHFGLYRRGGAPPALVARQPGEGRVPGGAAAHALCGALLRRGNLRLLRHQRRGPLRGSRRKSSTTTWCWGAAPTATGRTALSWPRPTGSTASTPSRQGARD